MAPLSRNVARKHAMEMLLTGDLISAPDAYRIGLVNPARPGWKRARRRLGTRPQDRRKSSHAVRIGKEAFYRQLEMGLDGRLIDTAEVMVENLMARDAEEGISAFWKSARPSGRTSDATRPQAFVACAIAAQHWRRRGTVKSRKARSFGGGCRPRIHDVDRMSSPSAGRQHRRRSRARCRRRPGS
jgi:hypothetical protein